MSKKITLIACGLTLVVFFIPLMWGVWLPDLWLNHTVTVAEKKLYDGCVVKVVQYWGSDFYTTEARFSYYPFEGDRIETQYVLDGDDRKRWRATITESGGAPAFVHIEMGGRVFDIGRERDQSSYLNISTNEEDKTEQKDF